ncbi:MAG: aspartate aminotransferase family protein [Eubacteriales bacterium]|nr:aspartate aminotransferase family protein [Eubacteriales bacterium]
MASKLGEYRDTPGKKSQEIKEDLFKYESGGTFWRVTYDSPNKIPVFERMKGTRVWDVDGNEYIDTYGQFAASCLGHAPEELISEVIDQMKTLMHISDMPNIPRAKLVKELAGIGPGEMKKDAKVQFEIGGSAAIELAIQIAESYTPHPQHDFISFFGAYHGRTTGALTVAPNVYFRDGMPSMANRVTRIPYAYCYRCYYDMKYPSCNMYCVKHLKRMFESPEFGIYDPKTKTNFISTLIVEPAQFHTGGIFPPKEFMQGLREICDEFGIVMIDDEIAIGMGRSGKWFCIEHYDVTPDLVVTSKALSGGIWPLSAVIGKSEVMSVWDDKPDKHMGTWHGNAVGCRAALTVIDQIKKRNLLKRNEEMGNYFLDGLKQLQKRHEMIGDVQGIGLGLSLELVRDRKTKEPAEPETIEVLKKALDYGVLICRAAYYGNRMTFMPAYIIEKSEIDTILDIVDRCIDSIEKKG